MALGVMLLSRMSNRKETMLKAIGTIKALTNRTEDSESFAEP